ncbi:MULTISPECIES: hypothetical protein [Bacillaceae]|uniref:hypothetical protein n=1 Tax=Bacillaceae TaxID=186817 RepID=UPI0014055794|nr:MULTISPECIES: hypothetical protein [Bacillaceae]MDT2046346.1 hypothetical protein [Priestia flexa]USY53633.1 hypothetical protein NIZ91_12800 [Bacillus sp. 1780r2a1]
MQLSKPMIQLIEHRAQYEQDSFEKANRCVAQLTHQHFCSIIENEKRLSLRK